MANKAFFLGAGFSMALADSCIQNRIKYPSLKDLTHKVIERFSKTSLETHLDEISPKYKEDIEQLLSYLYADLPWQNAQMRYLDKALYFELVSKIGEYFCKLDKESEYNFSRYKPFADYIIKNEISIITLNYDILLEKLLFETMSERYRSWNSYKGFYKQALTDLHSRGKSSGGLNSNADDKHGDKLPAIYKLHGSINWLWSATSPSEPIYFASGNEHKNLRKDLSEYIVPPVLDKTQFYNNNILKSIWSDAYSVLREADELYIVGFSFPVTDLSIRFLFNSALNDRKNCPKVYVVNTKDSISQGNKDCIKERYETIFTESQLDYTYCCEDSLNKFIEGVIKPEFNL